MRIEGTAQERGWHFLRLLDASLIGEQPALAEGTSRGA
jgi:hypothetical protein